MFHTTKIIQLLVRRQLGISLLFRTAGDVAGVFFFGENPHPPKGLLCVALGQFFQSKWLDRWPEWIKCPLIRGYSREGVSRLTQKSRRNPCGLLTCMQIPTTSLTFVTCLGFLLLWCHSCDMLWSTMMTKEQFKKAGVPEIRVNRKASSKDRFSLVAVAWMIHPMSWWLP